jgi:nonsense-mediated mRNA decay protein 3
MGYLMKAGDICLGYDLTETQLVDDEAEEMRAAGNLPDVVIVRKLYGGVATGEANAAKMRVFRLQRLDVEVAEDMKSPKARKNADSEDMDEEDFLREVEADREMRGNMNLYKSETVSRDKPRDDSECMQEEDDDEDDQGVKLDELLDGLVLDQGPDKDTGKMGDAFSGFTKEGEKAAEDTIGFIGREQAREVRDKDTAIAVSSDSFGKQYMNTQFKFT